MTITLPLQTDEPDEIVLQQEDYAYGFILEVLTSGLYPNKHHVIREYIQNAYDAIVDFRKLTRNKSFGKITIKITNPSVFIFDDGMGMDTKKINQYRYVGYSEKKKGEAAGFRGIGKLSGISVAEKLIVTTSRIGVDKRYTLIFDAQAMLSVIMSLKEKGQNISLNELIKKHTELREETEDSDAHYTLVELHNIRKDSRLLRDEFQVAEYLRSNAPVDFDPNFSYGATLDSWLRQHVRDYDTVPIFLNGNRLYKPFLAEIKPPQLGFIHDVDDDEMDDNIPALAAFWYCEHSGIGQFEDKEKRGLTYRLQNIAVGTNQLPRTSLWKANAEKAYYFWGEIHVCDPDVIPTSDRGDFEQNEARERLYAHSTQISRTLNKLANVSSAVRRAKDFIVDAETTVNQVKVQAENGEIPQELKFIKMYEVQDKIKEADRRLKDAPSDFRERGEQIIKEGKKLIKVLESDEAQVKDVNPTYDIKQKLRFTKEAVDVYDLIMKAIKEELYDQTILYERLIRKIHMVLGLKSGSELKEDETND